LAAVVSLISFTASAQTLDSLDLHNVKGEAVSYKGRRAVHLIELQQGSPDETLAIVKGSDFGDGVIEVEIAGVPAAGAGEGARGFVGIAFRVQDPKRYEAFYLRPTNGRANDQLRRNHATQYISHPDHPWHKLRRENPGVYESYADLVPGQWTKVRIAVSGSTARLYVHGAAQPALIVNDLKLGTARGRIALWIGEGTEAWFSNLRVRPSP
jgi:hypothetical protein